MYPSLYMSFFISCLDRLSSHGLLQWYQNLPLLSSLPSLLSTMRSASTRLPDLLSQTVKSLIFVLTSSTSQLTPQSLDPPSSLKNHHLFLNKDRRLLPKRGRTTSKRSRDQRSPTPRGTQHERQIWTSSRKLEGFIRIHPCWAQTNWDAHRPDKWCCMPTYASLIDPSFSQQKLYVPCPPLHHRQAPFIPFPNFPPQPIPPLHQILLPFAKPHIDPLWQSYAGVTASPNTLPPLFSVRECVRM